MRLGIPFGDWLPDLGNISDGSPYLTLAANVWPLGASGYSPAMTVAVSSAGATVAGKVTGTLAFNQQYMYTGHSTGDIWEWDVVAQTRAKRFTSASSDVDWSFTRIGANIIATNYKDPVVYQSARAASFSALISTSDKPQAKYVTTFGNRIILANIKTVATTPIGAAGSYPYTVWGSGINNADNFDLTNVVLRSWFLQLHTRYGEITGIVGMEDYIMVFLEKAIYAITSGGVASLDFSSRPISQNSGCVFPRSIVAYEDSVFYWGANGPAVATNSGSSGLLDGKGARSLNDTEWPREIDISLDRTQDVPVIVGGISTMMDAVVWSYPIADSATNQALFILNYKNSRMSIILFERPTDPSWNTQLFGIESRPEVYSGSGESWRPGMDLVLWFSDAGSPYNSDLYLFSETFQGGESDGSYVGPPIFETPYVEILKDKKTKVSMIRVISTSKQAATSTARRTIAHKAKDDPATHVANADVTADTSVVAVDDSGWIDLSGSSVGQYHSFVFKFYSANISHVVEIQGYDLQVEEMGDY